MHAPCVDDSKELWDKGSVYKCKKKKREGRERWGEEGIENRREGE